MYLREWRTEISVRLVRGVEGSEDADRLEKGGVYYEFLECGDVKLDSLHGEGNHISGNYSG